ncbi:MAG: sigma-70 family RNA polymerase sigma factor [Anaerolineales bacterium]|nr:sigma-70 family RNA polymerase sigma factor [Anaerolineales bacterium]
MKEAVAHLPMSSEQKRRITDVVESEGSRLRSFIRSRVPDVLDAEDILQDVFYELVEANRLLVPIEHITGWLFQVARNRITDLFRRRDPERFSDVEPVDGEELLLEDLLAAADEGPDAQYTRSALLAELEQALAGLPEAQREVFLAHEVEGRSFSEMAAESGVSLNTLLSRKRYAVLALRKNLQHLIKEDEV